MTPSAYTFKDVTLLITHYNRSRSLERLLQSFQNLNCTFGDIVVSDDGSKPEHLEYINTLVKNMPFRLITTEKNKGLGNNINKGQDAVKTPLTLYVQEDFEPTSIFPASFSNAVGIIHERKEVDIVRFYAYFKYPYLKPFRHGFSDMQFKVWYPGYKKFYAYSDHPHLRRSNFFEKFGRYVEGIKSDRTEYKMMMSFLKKKGKGVFYDDYTAVFEQKNSAEEPSTVKRNFWRESQGMIIGGLRHIYRHVRFNFDYFL